MSEDEEGQMESACGAVDTRHEEVNIGKEPARN